MKTAAGMLGAIWVIFALDWIIPLDFAQYGGMRPWEISLWSALGFFTHPWLHADLSHIISNSIPLFLLTLMLAMSSKKVEDAFVGIWLIGGILLWLVGGSGTLHVGASFLVFGLIGFLLASGVTERSPVAIGVAIVTLFLYGGTLFWGVLPSTPLVSWQAHLCGAIGGVMSAYIARGDDKDVVSTNTATY